MRSRSFAFLLSLPLLAAAPAVAQEVVQPLPGSTDADALAADMRRLATNPRDVDALVDAASLSLRLGDMRAAAALLARAENVDPRNGRVKAGQGAILVQSERPGEALRYFAQAADWGLDARQFAADRALAYDLTGQQERAQRDYRVALRDKPGADETIRNYALSLGISGQRAPALALLEPLVRKSDRGAWRAQAFVLAMTGDVGGASRIAATMMPGGAAGLSAFFERLPTLPATDRAFAVHFGEVRATPERIADARLAPPLTPLAREPGTATMLASNMPPATIARRGGRRDDQRAQVAAALTPTPIPAETRAAVAMPTQRGVTIASSGSARIPEASRPVATPGFSSFPATTPPPVAVASVVAARPIVPVTVVPATVVPTAAVPATVVPATVVPATVAPVTGAPASPTPATQTAVAALTTPSPVAAPVAVDVPAAAPVTSVAPTAVPLRSQAGARVSEDSILARIVAGLSIPAAELGVGEPERPAPAPEPTSVAVVAETPPPARAVVAPRSDPAIAAQAQADRVAEEKRAAAKVLADKRAADRKAVADKKALAEKKAAAAAKLLADKEAAEARKLARANPERIWVQVAGGAYAGDLPKAYAAVKAKAPAVFASRGGYTTPLRATNRVLTGPFKTDAEARAFVNDLGKRGVSAFTFTSDEGQPVKRLGAKGAATRDDDEPDAAPTTTKKKATKKVGRRR